MNNDLRPKLILVPTDFSETAGLAIRYASALAQRLDAHLLVLHADFFIPAVDFMATAAGKFSATREYLMTEAREQLQHHAEANIDRNVPYDTRVMMNSPVDAIVDAANESGAQLIVMGTHGRTGVPRLIVGSITETVMRKSPVPVIAVNGSSAVAGNIRKILCLVEYTDGAKSALRHAAALVNSRSAPIVLLRAIEDVDDSGKYAAELLRLHNWVPAELVDRCELKIVSSRATAESIVAMAEVTYPDLIVLGAMPNRTLTEVLRGTIAERVMQHSSCPVLTAVSGAMPDVAPPKTEKTSAIY